MLKKIKKIDISYLIILITAILIMSPYLSKNYASFLSDEYYGHDSTFHLANIIAVEENISLNNIIADPILPTIAKNYGYGTGIFYPRLAHLSGGYIYKIIKHFGATAVTSIKIVHFIALLLSGIFMFMFMRKLTKNRSISLLSAIFYMTFPYHLLDIFVRDALAESLIFIFIPLIFLSIQYLFEKEYKKFVFSFVIGYVGLVYSHLVCAIYFTILFAIYLIINYKKIFIKENIKKLFICAIFILMFISPFIIPMLEHKLLGSYAVFSEGHMSTADGVYSNALNISDYFDINSKVINNTYYFINIFVLILATLSISYIKKEKNKYRIINYFGILLFTIIALWMSTKLFPWKNVPDFMLMIQFPWRIETFICFGISVLAGLGLNFFNKNHYKLLVFILFGISLSTSFELIYRQTFTYKDNSSLDISISGMGGQFEYLPLNTTNNIEYFNNRNEDVLIISGEGIISNVLNETPYLEFDVETDEDVILELPRLYYLGYEITVISNDKTTTIDYSENENGFIQINISKSAKVIVQYKGTKGYIISKFIFLIACIGFMFYIMKLKKNKEVKK